jgi:hypothetical protein
MDTTQVDVVAEVGATTARVGATEVDLEQQAGPTRVVVVMGRIRGRPDRLSPRLLVDGLPRQSFRKKVLKILVLLLASAVTLTWLGFTLFIFWQAHLSQDSQDATGRHPKAGGKEDGYEYLFLLQVYIMVFFPIFLVGVWVVVASCWYPAPGLGGAPPGTLERLATQAYDRSVFCDEEGGQYSSMCPICLGDWEPQDTIKVTRCGHAFHERCVAEWLQRSRTCALCRQDLA